MTAEGQRLPSSELGGKSLIAPVGLPSDLVGDHSELLDGEAAGRYLSEPASTVDRLIRKGLLEGCRHPDGVRREALDDCLERCRIKPGELPWASRLNGRGEEPPITRNGQSDRRHGSSYSGGQAGTGCGERAQGLRSTP